MFTQTLITINYGQFQQWVPPPPLTERHTEKETERDRDRETETDRYRQRQTDRQTDRDRAVTVEVGGRRIPAPILKRGLQQQ